MERPGQAKIERLHNALHVPVIGLLGGVASGKSLVAAKLASLGAVVLDGDAAAHEILRLAETKQEIRNHFGEGVFNAAGEIDRKALAARVFGTSPEAAARLALLERITHPRIEQQLRRQAAAALESQPVKAFVLDAPVMLKAGWHRLCDKIVFVDAPRSVRVARAMARGWNEADFAAREAAQESLDQKRKHADVILDNSKSAESTYLQVERLWSELFG